MSELKTKPTDASVESFLVAIEDPQRQADCRAVLKLMKKVTGKKPKMWGAGMVGFGTYHYKYANGREGDWFVTGFAPRKRDLTLYIMSGFKQYEPLMKKLGKHKTGVSCLYIKKLDDLDISVLEKLITASVEYVIRTNP
jgi:hypothetical protein